MRIYNLTTGINTSCEIGSFVNSVRFMNTVRSDDSSGSCLSYQLLSLTKLLDAAFKSLCSGLFRVKVVHLVLQVAFMSGYRIQAVPTYSRRRVHEWAEIERPIRLDHAVAIGLIHGHFLDGG